MTNWVEIAALVAGPVAAVSIPLDRERRERTAERKSTILRQLLLSRTSPADAALTAAIGLVPIEFAKSDAVLDGWETFMRAASQRKATDEQVRTLLKR